MISRIIDFSVRHKLAVLGIIALTAVAGWQAMLRLPLDATPDLGDTQVIIFSHWDRSPDIVEDQVTYPIVTARRPTRQDRAGFLRFRLFLRLRHL
jgi:copper/silver efflux system protein